MRIDENEVTTVNGGLGLIDIAAKRRTLFLTRLRAQGGEGGNAECGVAPGMGLAITQVKSPKHTSDNTKIRGRMGVCGTQEAGEVT